MAEEDWELIPHKILAELRDEVHVLKDKLSQPSTRKDMVMAMKDLRMSIDKMHSIFQTALETSGEDEMGKRLSAIEKQNEQIAQALVTVADLVEGMSGGHHTQPHHAAPRPPIHDAPPRMPQGLRQPAPQMAPNPMGMAPMPPRMRAAPRMAPMPPMGAAPGMPPPPPPAPKKKGFFG